MSRGILVRPGGWVTPPARPVVGDLAVGDEEMDMAGALAGCPTSLVQSASTRLGAITPEPTYRGTLEDVVAVLE
jgi:hypothetical protein